MKKVFLKYLLLVIPFAVILTACSNELDINQFKTAGGSGNIKGDTVYIPVQPEWGGFNKPTAIIVGKEPFIYVCDTGNDRVVMMDISGKVIGSVYVKNPVALAQDYRLNLLVCGQWVSPNNGKTYSAVYKIDLLSGNHNIATSPVKMILPDTTRTEYLSKSDREYTAVCTFYDNSFYVARKGNTNDQSFVDPANSILIYTNKDSLVGRVALLEPLGTGLVSAYNISSLTSFPRKNVDILVTYSSDKVQFKSQWLTYVSTTEKSGYESRLSPTDAVFMTPNRFTLPTGSTIDDRGNLFVVDAGKDSVYKFNSQGAELQSFGGPKVFKNPHGIAYFDKTIYVTDTDNNRILRFVLSTDIK